MTEYELWATALGVLSVVINIGLFLLIHRDVAGAAEATRLDHDRRKKQATLEWATAAFDRQWGKGEELPNFADLKAFREFASRPEDVDDPRSRAVTEWLDMMEDLSTGVNMDVYDIAVVERLVGARTMRGWRNLRPFVERRREMRSQPTLYCEFEQLSKRLYAQGGLEVPADLLGSPEFM